MKNKKLSYGILVVIFLVAGGALLVTLNRPANTQEINSFEDCANAGYPVLESYPRQCKAPDGRTFVSQMDVLEITKDISCHTDEDCQLVNRKLGFSCCWAGACESIDYSLDKWIAVNKDWFAEQRDKNCPPKEDCGPAPMCAIRAINESFKAKCIEGICQKVPE